MGFIFGLLVGAAISSGGGSTPPILGSIPLRCLAALDVSDDAYRTCRGRSLSRELYDRDQCDSRDRANEKSECYLPLNLTWEIAGLRQMQKANEANIKAK